MRNLLKIIVIGIFTLSTGCVTMIRGSKEPISIDSNPRGAEVISGNRILGKTPLKVKVWRKDQKLVIRKEGFEPETLEIAKRGEAKYVILSLTCGLVSGFFTLGLIGMFTGFGVEEDDTSLAQIIAKPIGGGILGAMFGSVFGPLVSLGIDYKTGAINNLQKKEFKVNLVPRLRE